MIKETKHTKNGLTKREKLTYKLIFIAMMITLLLESIILLILK